MGTDIYHCSIQSHRVLDKEAAIRRAVAYGFGPQSPPAVLAAHEGPFLEITLDMRSVYFDAPVSWDPLMLLRFLDEAVYHAARYDQSGFDFENTPISRRYPGLWTMGFKAPRELGEDITLVQIERTEPPSPPGPRRDWTDDRARAVFFVPEHLAPNLASFGFWESRAWGGHSWDAERQLTDLRPWQCEARLVEGVAGLSAIVGQATSYPDGLHRPALCPRAAGGLWLCNGMELYRLDPGGLNATHVGSLPRPQMKMFATACREDRDGTLWIGTNKGLLSYKPHTGFRIETTGHAGKELHALALTPDGRVVVAGVGGIWIREEDGSFTHVREGLLDTTVDHLVVDDEGVMWASGSKGLSRRTPDGGVERFQKTQGVGPSPRILPLPDGAVYITSYGGTGRIARGGSRAEPHSGLDGALARGVAAGTRGPDGVVWALSSAGMLLRLRADEPPRAVALVPPIEDTWHARLLATADGDLWVMLQSRLLRYSAADQTRADASPPLDSRPVPPLQLSPPPKAASGIDFRGKVVVLTGTFSRLSRDEAAALLSAHGANIGSGVTAKTDYLIAGKGAGSKATKAAKLGVTVLGEDALPTP